MGVSELEETVREVRDRDELVHMDEFTRSIAKERQHAQKRNERNVKKPQKNFD